MLRSTAATPWRERLRRTPAPSGTTRTDAEEEQRQRRSAPSAAQPAVARSRRRRAAARRRVTGRPAHRRWRRRCSRLISSSMANDASSITQRERGRPGVVELLELRHDQQRRDLGPHRHVAGDEDDRAVLAERRGRRRARSRSARPGSSAGRMTRAKVCQRLRRAWRRPPRPRRRGPRAPAAPCARRRAGR